MATRTDRNGRPLSAAAAVAVKRAGIIAVVLLASLVAADAHAQVWGIWSDPAPVAQGSYDISAHFLAGDPVGLMGQVRSGLPWEDADAGVQIGIPDFDGTDFSIAGDVRYLLLPESADFPLNLSVDGGLAWTKIDAPEVNIPANLPPELRQNIDVDVADSFFSIDFGGIAHKPIETQSGFLFIPYGGLFLSIAHASGSTDTDVNFRAGTAVPLAPRYTVSGELNLSSRDGWIYVGLGAGISY